MQFSWLSPSLLCALISTACVGNVTQVSKNHEDLAIEDGHFYKHLPLQLHLLFSNQNAKAYIWFSLLDPTPFQLSYQCKAAANLVWLVSETRKTWTVFQL